MEPLCGGSRSYCPCVHGTEFEGLFDDATTCLKNRRIQVQFVERRVTVDEISDARRRAANLYVIGRRTGYCFIVEIGQFRQTCLRHRSWQHDEPVGVQCVCSVR